MSPAKIDSPGRLYSGPPLAVVDIGSNSVRLVVYERLSRAPTALFNEKALCGLGREVQTTGLLPADAVEQALAALKRYRALCSTMGAKQVLAIATAACRDAKNGRTFIKLAERTIRANIDVSHLQLAGVPSQDLRKLKGKAIHVHISDCDGKVHGDLPPGRGVVDFPPYLKAIKQLEIPEATISIELEYSPEPAKLVDQSRTPPSSDREA